MGTPLIVVNRALPASSRFTPEAAPMGRAGAFSSAGAKVFSAHCFSDGEGSRASKTSAMGDSATAFLRTVCSVAIKGSRFWVAYVVLSTVALVSLTLLFRMTSVVRARGRDVYFWHSRLVSAECRLPVEQRHFIEFKIAQSRSDKVNQLRETFLAPTSS